MPLRDVTAYRDKTQDWTQWFVHQRARELAPLVTPALLAEHARNPSGVGARHSPALQEVLNFVRNTPIFDKPFAYIEVPYQRYRLARLQGRGAAPKISDAPVFRREESAIHAVFLARLDWQGLLPKTSRGKRGQA